MNINIRTEVLNKTGPVLVIMACAFILLYKLGTLEIRLWDEGRNAVNAYEMLQNGKVLIRYYDGQPDFWELKPPLLIWFQAASMRMFGFNEWAVRLPSSLFALLTVALILRFTQRTLHQPWVGYMSSLVLITSAGYTGAHNDIGNHVARTGDHESMLIFFLTWSLFSFYQYTSGWRKPDLILATIALICATFTKSIIGLVFLPGMFLYILWERKVKTFFKKPEVYYCILSYLVILGLFYGYREMATPGYLKNVWNNEMLMRYINKSEFYKYTDESIFYYFLSFFNVRFVPWIYSLPFFMGIGFLIREEPLRSFFRMLILCFISLLLIISIGTNNSWYDAPLYPLMALITGIGLNYLSELLVQNRNMLKRYNTRFIRPVFLILVFCLPYGYLVYRIDQESLANDRFVDRVGYGKLMKGVKTTHPEIKAYAVLNNVFNTPLNFYTKVFNEQYGYQIENIDSLHKVGSRNHVLFCGNAWREKIKDQYTYTALDSCYACYFIKIK